MRWHNSINGPCRKINHLTRHDQHDLWPSAQYAQPLNRSIVQSFSPFIPLDNNSHAQIPKLPNLIGIYWKCVLVSPRLTPCCPPLPPHTCKMRGKLSSMCDFVCLSASLFLPLVCHVLYRFSFAFIAIFIWSEYHLWQLKVFSANLFSIFVCGHPINPNRIVQFAGQLSSLGGLLWANPKFDCKICFYFYAKGVQRIIELRTAGRCYK